MSTSGATAGGGLTVVRRALSSAEILALTDAAPITLVAAPGAGKVIFPFYLSWVFTPGATRYNGGIDDVPGVGGDELHLLAGAQKLNGYHPPTERRLWSAAAISAGWDPGGANGFTGINNQPLKLGSDYPATFGPITASTKGAGGAGYVIGDTGTIDTGTADAAYVVDTVDGGGAVLTYHLTGAGGAYSIENGKATTVGGAQPGVGAGFTVNVTAVTQGNGTVAVTAYYTIIY